MFKKTLIVSTMSLLMANAAVAGDSFGLRLSASSDSGVPYDQVTNHRSPMFNGVGKANTEVEFMIEGQTFKTKTTSDGLFKWQSLPLNDGQYQLIATNEGKQVQTSFIIDTETELSAGYELSNGNLLFSGKSEAGNEVDVVVGGKQYSTRTDPSGEWVLIINDLQIDGQVYAEVVSTDIAGNMQSQTVVITAEQKPHFIDGGLSEMHDTGIPHDGVTSHNNGLVFEGTTSPAASVTFDIAATYFQVKADDSGHWSVTVPPYIVDGVWDWGVTSRTESGDFAVISGNLVIDTEAPHLEVNPVANKLANGTFEVTGFTSEQSSIELQIDGMSYRTIANGDWKIDVSRLPVGEYGIKVTASDIAYNQSSEFTTVIIK